MGKDAGEGGLPGSTPHGGPCASQASSLNLQEFPNWDLATCPPSPTGGQGRSVHPGGDNREPQRHLKLVPCRWCSEVAGGWWQTECARPGAPHSQLPAVFRSPPTASQPSAHPLMGHLHQRHCRRRGGSEGPPLKVSVKSLRSLLMHPIPPPLPSPH